MSNVLGDLGRLLGIVDTASRGSNRPAHGDRPSASSTKAHVRRDGCSVVLSFGGGELRMTPDAAEQMARALAKAAGEVRSTW